MRGSVGIKRTRPSCSGASKTSKLVLRGRMARRSIMRVAAYVRVSTSRQVKLQTIEQQLEMVSRYAREKEWELAEEDIFRDDGYSGTTLKRPALDALRDRRGCGNWRSLWSHPRNGWLATTFTRWSSSRSWRRLAVRW